MMPISPAVSFAVLSPLDWCVIFFYAIGMLAVGYYFSRQTKNTEDYLLAGRRMNPVVVGLSFFASLLSTISYLGYPGEIIGYGPMYLGAIASFPLIWWIVGWLIIPYFMKFRVTSAYEILESRFGISVRLLGAFMFLCLRLMWMALIIFATTDKVLVPILEIDPSWVPAICAVLGLITISYTAMGGLRAVIVTDVVQSFILFGAALLALILITRHFGGIGGWWPDEWPAHWPELEWGYDPTARMSFVGVFLAVLFWYICTAGSDQIAIQRYLATRDVKAARKVLAVNLVSNVLVLGLMGLMGLALLAYFRVNPGLLGEGMSIVENSDELFPRFIVEALPGGISGLVIAGLLAAAMSSLSSGVNSSASVIATDLMDRFRGRKTDDAAAVRRVKGVSFVIGGVVIALSLLVSLVKGNLLEVSFKVSDLLVAPLFVLFFLAMWVPWANTFGAWCAAIAAVTVAVLIAYWEEMTGTRGISFLWIMPGSLATGILVGCVASWSWGEKLKRKET